MLIFLSFRGHEGVKFYFGFLSGKLSKAIYFLFCSCLVYPLNYKGESAWQVNFAILAMGLTVVASVQIFKYCCANTSDTHEEAPMMDDAPKNNDQENLIM